MNRRSMLGLSLAAMGGVFAPRFGRWYREANGLILWGDGVHDDAVALQALFDRKGPVRFDGKVLPRDGWTLTGRHFRLGQTVFVPPTTLGGQVCGNVFTWSGGRDGPVFEVAAPGFA